MKFIDLFSGIGGFRSALEINGHKCLAFAEIDKYARQSYKSIYNTTDETEWHDVTTISNDDFRQFRGKCDIIVGGFPCQAFSVAGKRRGFDDTRGTLFFEIARAIKEIKPRYALLENVRGLLSHDKGRTFGTIIQALDELGYIVEWGLFNSKFWGVPQNRERVFILVTRKDIFEKPKLFDLLKKQTEINTKLLDVLENEVEEKYYLSKEKMEKLTLNHDLSGNLNIYDYKERDKVYSVNKISPTLNTMQGGDRQPKIAIKEAVKKGYSIATVGDSINFAYTSSKLRRGRVGKQVSNTLTANGNEMTVFNTDLRIRRLTPLECWRLQGFTDEQFYKAKNSGVSNSQLYKQAGNSVTVNVIDHIVKSLNN